MKQKIFLPKSFGFNEYFDEKYWAKITFACLLTYLLTFPLSDLSINLWKKLFLVFNPHGMIPIFEVAYTYSILIGGVQKFSKVTLCL